MLSHFSCVWLFPIPWTVVHQAALSMGFSRQEYWSGSPSPPPGDLPHPGMEPTSPALASRFSTTSATWGAWMTINKYMNVKAMLMWDVSFVSDFVHLFLTIGNEIVGLCFSDVFLILIELGINRYESLKSFWCVSSNGFPTQSTDSPATSRVSGPVRIPCMVLCPRLWVRTNSCFY